MPELILGIDPGTRVTGYGLILDAAPPALEAHGCIRPPPSLPLEERLHRIHQALLELIESHHPDLVAVEDTYIGRSPKSSLALGQAQAAALIAAASRQVPLRRYPPSLVKEMTTGRGNASKDQVRNALTMILGSPARLATDAADALGVAYTASLCRQQETVLRRA